MKEREIDCFHPLSGLSWSSVEDFVNLVRSVLEGFCRPPTQTHILVSNPLNEGMELPTSPFAVTYQINFPLFLVVEDLK
jgi:hypothetical protein